MKLVDCFRLSDSNINCRWSKKERNINNAVVNIEHNMRVQLKKHYPLYRSYFFNFIKFNIVHKILDKMFKLQFLDKMLVIFFLYCTILDLKNNNKT